jgi:hypothetical protein
MSTSYEQRRGGFDLLACPLQYSLATAFFCMTAEAVYCVVYRYLPVWILIPYGCLVASRIVVKRGASYEMAWGLFSLGWMLVVFNTCWTQLRCFEKSGLPSPDEISRDIVLVFLTGIAFPLVCSVWAFPVLVEAFVKRRSPARKWLLLFLVIANVDLSIMAFFVCNLVREAKFDS